MSDYYSTALEFFIENNIQLNKQQLESLKEFAIVSNPLNKLKNKIEEIKNNRPDEYSSVKDIDNYINKNYNSIVNSANELEKEPEKIESKNRTNAITTFLTHIAAMLAMVTIVLAPLSIIVMLLNMVAFAISDMAIRKRAKTDISVRDNLIKIQVNLKKILKRKDLPEDQKRKVSKMIQSIDDAVISTSSVEKKV